MEHLEDRDCGHKKPPTKLQSRSLWSLAQTVGRAKRAELDLWIPLLIRKHDRRCPGTTENTQEQGTAISSLKTLPAQRTSTPDHSKLHHCRPNSPTAPIHPAVRNPLRRLSTCDASAEGRLTKRRVPLDEALPLEPGNDKLEECRLIYWRAQSHELGGRASALYSCRKKKSEPR